MTTPSAKARVSFASLTSNNLGTVRKLNSVLFPIKYSEKFYQDILLPEVEDFCKLGMSPTALRCLELTWPSHPVYYNDIPVGTVCCRLETKEGRTSLYLMTMGILAVRLFNAHANFLSHHVAVSLEGSWLSKLRTHLEGCLFTCEDRSSLPSRSGL